jgi:hypothetical protein
MDQLTLCDDANGHNVQAILEPGVVIRRARHAAADALYHEADDVGKGEQDGIRLSSEKGVSATGRVSTEYELETPCRAHPVRRISEPRKM